MTGTLFKAIGWVISIIAGIYIAVCIWFYVAQDKLIFQGVRYPTGYKYHFNSDSQEYNIKTADGNIINCGLFKVSQPKGLIFYLHGNGGALESWYVVVRHYNNLGYDVFIPDYPGYGKSSGTIRSQQQLLDAVQAAYNYIKSIYQENQIVILGYSIGTGPAAWLASTNRPRKLILLAPYYSLTDEATTLYPFLPGFILKYPIPTYQYIQRVKAPITIVHGDRDELIDHSASVRLTKYFKPGDRLITLPGQNHNGIDDNGEYQDSLKNILH